MPTLHNLPPQPYKRFFGREDSINKIKETLLEGGTFIASIDGVGGIGKTALSYYFCKEIIIPSDKFNYLVWLSAKETVFDPFSKDILIKTIRRGFRGTEELVDTVLSVIGFEDMINFPFDDKREFVEKEVFEKEKIFIVLDNLESINDEQFFDYITKTFNRCSSRNRDLKILTTSRRRKKIVDFPIEIEGLSVGDALKMLKYLASEYNIKDILNATDYDNIKLLEKVGFVPLGIEFIIGQMSLGKNRGQIYNELQGYPSLEEVKTPEEKRKKLSDIILFSFKNMYETLNDEQQYVFKVITSLIRNKTKKDPPISFELLMSVTDFSKNDLEEAIEVLMDNKLVTYIDNEYVVTPMAMNFVRQYYDDFGVIEDTIVEKKNKIVMSGYKVPDKVDLFLNSIRELVDNNRLEEAEQKLLNGLDLMLDSRIYHELAKIQRDLNKFIKAEDSFRQATELNPKDIRIWWEWINMEDKRGRHNIALQLTEKALEKTNNDISILLQRISIFRFLRKYDQMRKEAQYYLEIYEKEGRLDEILRLLRNWKNIEYNLIRNENENPDWYFKTIEKLIYKESDLNTKIQLSREGLNIAKRMKTQDYIEKFTKNIKSFEGKIYRDMGSRIRNLKRLFNSRNFEKAKREARKILNWIHDDDENYDDENYIEYSINALRVLLQILSSEKDFEKIISIFEDYKEIGYKDKNCIDIYEKAKKEKKKIEQQKLISSIMVNIHDIESSLREIVMWSLDYEEEKLINLVESKNKKDWIEQWQTTRNKSLKKHERLIYFSDLSHLRSLLAWTKSDCLEKINEDSVKFEAKELIKKIVAYLENYISSERNESFHSRLYLYDKDQLNYFLVDTQRTLDEIKKLTNLLGFA